MKNSADASAGTGTGSGAGNTQVDPQPVPDGQGQNPRPHPPAESYTITYMPGDYSTGPTHAITYWDYEEAHAADYLKYERPGYSQTGWSYHSDGDELIYHFNDKIPYKQDMTLYPYWVRNSKPLTLTVYTVGNGTVYLNGSPLYNGWHWALEPGQSLTFTFYPKPNHYVYSILFGNWYRSGQYGNQYTVSYNDMGGRDQSMTVRFESIYHPPKTGDESNIALWAALGILAAGGLIAVALISKKKK